MFFSSLFSPLKKYDFESYNFNSQVSIRKATDDILAIANILLDESIKSNKNLRFEAGSLLSEWMSNHDDYYFGSGHLKNIFEGKIELAIVSMSAQIKYCLENNADSSYDPKTRLGIWKIISQYVANPKNKVKLTQSLKQLIRAYNDNNLEQFLEEYE